jgi:hypothetical protein
MRPVIFLNMGGFYEEHSFVVFNTFETDQVRRLHYSGIIRVDKTIYSVLIDVCT